MLWVLLIGLAFLAGAKQREGIGLPEIGVGIVSIIMAIHTSLLGWVIIAVVDGVAFSAGKYFRPVIATIRKRIDAYNKAREEHEARTDDTKHTPQIIDTTAKEDPR